MKYAMKMVLIPESEYRRLKPEGGIKEKVNKILSGKRDHKAAKEMTQMFGRYLRTTRPAQATKPLNKDAIVDHLPAMYRDKVSKFLAHLQSYGSTWTDDSEFVTKSGEVIGDVIELLKEAFVGTRRTKRDLPLGWSQFIKEIVAANVPRGTFKKQSTKEDIAREKAERRQGRWEDF